jgi:hypothetical protein
MVVSDKVGRMPQYCRVDERRLNGVLGPVRTYDAARVAILGRTRKKTSTNC